MWPAGGKAVSFETHESAMEEGVWRFMNREFLVTIYDNAMETPRALSLEEAEREGFSGILSDFQNRLSKGVDFYQYVTVEDIPLVDNVIVVRGELTDYYKDVSGIEHTRFVSVGCESDADIKLNDALFVCNSGDRKEYTVSLFMEALTDGVVLSRLEKLVLTRHLVI